MKSKRLNWNYDDDFFNKKSDMTEKVFDDEHPEVKNREIETSDHIAHETMDYNINYDFEYYDTLRDNINIFNKKSNSPTQLIAFIGSDYGEGVSTIVSKFGINLAMHSDDPILIVDTNFSKPSIHNIFGARISPGIGEVLVNSYETKDVIQHTSYKNLHLICSGDVPSNPASKFDSQTFHEILTQWKQEYKFVLFDTPPMQCDMKQCDMNASVRLASLVDGVIIVIEAGQVRYEVAQNIKDRLSESHANILGVVLNKTKYYIPQWLYKRL